MSNLSRRSSIPNVLFVEDFDDLPSEQPRAASPSSVGTVSIDAAKDTEAGPPMVPEIDLERLKAEARDEGFAAGLKAAENSLAAQRIAMLSRIEDRLKEGSGAISVAIEQDLRAVAHVAFSMISECLPAFCQRHGTSEMTALLRSTLPTLASEPNLLITVAQDSVELAQNEVSLLAERVAGQVTVTAARDMLAGDVRLTWQDGMACRDVRRLRAHMLERLAEIGLLEPSGKDLVT